MRQVSNIKKWIQGTAHNDTVMTNLFLLDWKIMKFIKIMETYLNFCNIFSLIFSQIKWNITRKFFR